MREITEALMRSVYDKCTEEQFDDLESQFENIEVIWNKMMEEMGERNRQHIHFPVVELHVGEVTHDFVTAVRGLVEEASLLEESIDLSPITFDFFRFVFFFGYEVGRMNWPLTSTTCEEVHSNSHG